MSFWKKCFNMLLYGTSNPISDCGSYNVQVIPIQDCRPLDTKESLVSYIEAFLGSNEVREDFTLSSYIAPDGNPHRVIKHPKGLVHIDKKLCSHHNFIKFDIKNSCGEVVDMIPVFKILDFNDMERIDIAFTELLNSQNRFRKRDEIDAIYNKLTKKCT